MGTDQSDEAMIRGLTCSLRIATDPGVRDMLNFILYPRGRNKLCELSCS